MPTFGKRLRFLRKRRNMTQKDVATILGLSESAVSMYERDDRSPSLDLVQQIASYFDVTTDFLLGNTTSSGQKSEKRNDKRFIDNSDNRSTMVFHPNYDVLRQSNVFPIGPMVSVPIVAVIPCGEPLLTEDNMIGAIPVDTSVINLNGGNHVWIRAQGRSMENKITDGSYVLIREQPEVENGEIAAVCIDGENATLKRYFLSEEIVTLISDNPDFPPMTYPSSRVRVVGLVVWILSRP